MNKKITVIFSVAMTLIAVIILLSIITSSTIVGGGSNTNQTDIKYAHISYDDVYLSLDDLCEHQLYYSSIFQSPRLLYLKLLHELTGVHFTLYVYENAGDFSISDVPDKWKNEFEENSDWLKFGYHGISPEVPKFDGNVTVDEFIKSYTTVKNAVSKFAGNESYSSILRLSYFTATDEIIEYLNTQGIIVLLSADDERLSYNLNSDENKFLIVNETYQKNNMTFWRTDLRFEHVDNIISELNNESDDSLFVLFTHEWAFFDTAVNVGISSYCLSKKGYRYI